MRCAVLTMVSFLLVLIACNCRPVENYTETENAARVDRSRLGRACITVQDAMTGQPVAECNYGSLEYSMSAVDCGVRNPSRGSRLRHFQFVPYQPDPVRPHPQAVTDRGPQCDLSSMVDDFNTKGLT